MVFIGGAVAPLLQTHPVIPIVRATSDVDAVVASASYAAFGLIQEKLPTFGFRLDPSDAKHVHRWRAPDNTPFDLVPAGAHLGGTGSNWDHAVLETAVTTELKPGLFVRHASAPGFLALKWAAFWDRGAQDPFSSHDLEDILALVVCRDSVVSDIANAPRDIREQIKKGFRWLGASRDYEDLLAAHLNNAQDFRRVAQTFRDRLEQTLAL